MSTIRVASVAWKLRHVRGDSDYFGHFYDLVNEAYHEGAKVVVFPELHVLELLPLASDLYAEDAAKFLVQYSEAIEEWIQRISTSSGMIIVGGSHFRYDGDLIKNVCAVGIPGSELVFAEKNNLTVYERDVWNLANGTGLSLLPENLGVTICYDSEFPAAGKALAEAGMLIQCVPSWTETQRGFQRVRWSCLARAVEHQHYVVHAALVGELGREPVPTTFGSSAIIAPSVEPFPLNSVLRETQMNEEGVVVAELDLDLLVDARSSDEVQNWLDRDSGNWEVADRSIIVKKEGPISDEDETNPNGELN